MEMPAPGAEHAQLAQLAGRWEGPETLGPSPVAPEGGTARGRWDSHMALHDLYLFTDYTQERNGHVSYRAHGVLGWDGHDRCYTMRWFDSTGADPGRATGEWHGDALVLRQSTAVSNSRWVFELGDHELRLRIESSQNGKEWAPSLVGTYARV